MNRANHAKFSMVLFSFTNTKRYEINTNDQRMIVRELKFIDKDCRAYLHGKEIIRLLNILTRWIIDKMQRLC